MFGSFSWSNQIPRQNQSLSWEVHTTPFMGGVETIMTKGLDIRKGGELGLMMKYSIFASCKLASFFYFCGCQITLN